MARTNTHTHTRAQDRAPDHMPALSESARAHIAALGDMADERERARAQDVAHGIAQDYARELRMARACPAGTRAKQQHYNRAAFLENVARLAHTWGAR